MARAWTSAMFLLMVALAGCADTRGPAASPDPSPTSAVASPATTATGHPRLDLADDGRTVRLRVGGEASITLVDPSYQWGEPRVRGASVSVSEIVSDEPQPGGMWSVVAKQAGTATVTIAGSPACRSATPRCNEPDLLWTVGFEVTA